MRTGHPSAFAHRRNDLALPHSLPNPRLDPIQMHQRGTEPVTVIDDQRRPGVVQIRFRQGHDPVCWRPHWRTNWRGNIDTVMRLARFTVQNALTAYTPLMRPSTGQRNPLRK